MLGESFDHEVDLHDNPVYMLVIKAHEITHQDEKDLINGMIDDQDSSIPTDSLPPYPQTSWMVISTRGSSSVELSYIIDGAVDVHRDCLHSL